MKRKHPTTHRASLERRARRKARTSEPLWHRLYHEIPRPYWLILAVLLATVICLGVLMALRAFKYNAARQEYEAYRSLNVQYITPQPQEVDDISIPTELPTSTPKPFYSAKLSALRNQNAQVVAWLDIPNTEIQYPVVQGKNNEYYLTHTFSKKRNESGAIFLDYRNTSDLSDFNPVIYGHNMRDGSMFHQLRAYDNQDFFNEHTTILLTLPHEERVYKIIAAYICKDGFDFRAQNCLNTTEKERFFQTIRSRSMIKSSRHTSGEDFCITLVTCTGGTHDWYWVVQAVLVSVSKEN